MKRLRKAVALSVLLTILGVLFSPVAGAWPTPTRVYGVRGIILNGSGGGDGLGYLGLYGIDTGTGPKVGFCIQWQNAAPNPTPGAYTVGPTITDPILSNAAAQIALIYATGGSETQLAAFAVVAKMRSNQLGIPGATIYGPGGTPAAPTGPGSFLLSDGVPGPTEYNSGNPTSAAAVANAAWTAWQTATRNGINWTPTVTLGAHPGISGGTMTATIQLNKQDGTPVGSGVIVGPSFTLLNGTAMTPASPVTNAAGQATVSWTVTDGTAASGITVDQLTPTYATQNIPSNPAEQIIVTSNNWITRSDSAQADAPLGQISIEKRDAQTGARVGGAILRLRFDADGNGSFETTVGSYTSSAAAATAVADRPAGRYELVETAAPSGYAFNSTPVTGTLAPGGTLALRVNNQPFGDIAVEKRDAVTGELVAGALLQVREDFDGDGVWSAIGTVTSTSTGPVVIEDQPADEYQLVELVAPNGYALNSTPVTGTLAWGDTLTLTVENQPFGSILVNKVDGVDGTPVPGAELELSGPAPSTTVVWSGTSGTSPIAVPNLPAGTYTLVETAAPAGYHVVSEPSTVTLAWGQTATVSLDNFVVIDGSTTASETIIETDGSISEVYDSVSLTGVKPDQQVEITAVLYGVEQADGELSVDLADGICTEENKLQEITITVTGNGPHVVGPFDVPTGFRGVTTFEDGVTGDGPQTWLDHCGQPNETIIMVPEIEGSTLAMDIDPASDPADDEIGNEIVSVEGAQVWDRVNVDGLATGETATITATLYADPTSVFPFDQPFSADACVAANQVGETVTITVTGTNDADTPDVFHVGPFPIPAGFEGQVSFLDTVTSTVTSTDDPVRSEDRDWTDDCGTETETLTVRKPVEASTIASVTTTIDGEPLTDPIVSDGQLLVWDSIVTNLNPGETASVTAVAYGYFPTDTPITLTSCVEGLVMGTFTVTVTGPGPHLVGPIRTDAGASGRITWVDGLTADIGEDVREWADDCGTPAETVTIRQPITGVTQASHQTVTNTGDVELYDEITIDGLQEGETATVTANLYGPFDERPVGDSCGEDKLLATFELEVTGPGPHLIGPYKVPADMVGFVTWQDGVETDDGRVHLHGCGLLTETTEITAPSKPAVPDINIDRTATPGFSTSSIERTTTQPLARTGMAAMWLVGAGSVLIGVGFVVLVMLRARREANEA